jgi:flagellar biosynthetic protein FliQ
MTPDTVLDVGRQAITLAALLSAPLLLAALIVGLLVSIFQAATQINEMTLSFIPKLVALGVTLMLAGPWLLSTFIGYTRQLIEGIPGMLG